MPPLQTQKRSCMKTFIKAALNGVVSLEHVPDAYTSSGHIKMQDASPANLNLKMHCVPEKRTARDSR